MMTSEREEKIPEDSIEELLAELRQQNVRVWCEEGRLFTRASKGAITPALHERMKKHKSALIKFLSDIQQTDFVIPLISRRNPIPLSFAEERQWFIQQLEQNASIYNIHVGFYLSGVLDERALEKSVEAIIHRHESLRTTFNKKQGQSIRVIAEIKPFSLPIKDLSHLSESNKQHEILQQSTIEATTSFDLKQGPLFLIKLLRMTPEQHVFLLTMHHAITDGWSMGIIWRELRLLYTSFRDNKPFPLPELPVQYADFASWQRSNHFDFSDSLDYWKTHLQDAPPLLALPTDYSRPQQPSYQGGNISFTLPSDLTEKIQQLCQHKDVTLFMLLLTAFKVLLFRYSGEINIVVGTPVANRTYKEIEGVVGFFVNTLVLNDRISNDSSFIETLASIKQTAIAAYQHQDLPFEKLVETLKPERSLSHHPLFQVMFVLQNFQQEILTLEGIDVSRLPGKSHTAKFDLMLVVHEEDNRLKASFNYSKDLFEEATIAGLAKHFQVLVEGIVANPLSRIADLPLLTESDRHQLLIDWNNSQSHYPKELCIQQIFERQVELTPEAIAVEWVDGRLTYHALNEQANLLARELIAVGVEVGIKVGICFERSQDMIIGLIAILKAGGAYVPLDFEYPEERLAFLLSDSGVQVLLVQNKIQNKLPATCLPIVIMGQKTDSLSNTTVNPNVDTMANDAAYIIYTSGSTGQPKGVIVPHKGVVRLVKNTNYVTLNAQQSLLQLAPLTFDASTFEIWGALLNGARLVIMPAGTPSLSDLASTINQYKITTLWLTAGLFHLMVDEQLETLKKVPQLLAGGSTLSISHVQQVLSDYSGVLINGYGPTENTTFTCCYRMTTSTLLGMTVPIGRPIANTQVYILDEYLNPVPIGVPGNLYTGGDGLALGYLNLPELTKDNFIPNPFELDKLLYNTGDRARYLADGNIEFLGRNDRQVKVNGFRIEPREIEMALNSHSAISDVTVVARPENTLNKLVAYIIVVNDKLTPSELRTFLSEKLPAHMVPTSFVQLHALPLTPNGKIDFKQLPNPDENSDALTETVYPRDIIEQQLTNIWENVLNKQSIGIHDNFFDLGGHSLLAVMLFEKINKVTKQKLPLTILFQAPTIVQQAEIIRHRGGDTLWNSLVVIQPKGTKQPLFLVPPAAGTGLGYRRLAHFLGNDQPVYSFQPLIENGEPLHISTEAMAANYIQEMTKFQPGGSYFIGGMCFGAHVAWEMAQQLEQLDCQVQKLVLIDPAPPANGPDWQWIPPPKKTPLYLTRRFFQTMQDGSFWGWLNKQRKLLFNKEYYNFIYLLETHQQAQVQYHATPCMVNTLLIQSDQYGIQANLQRWKSIATGEFKTVVITNSTHLSLLVENNEQTREMASIIQDYLAGVDNSQEDNDT